MRVTWNSGEKKYGKFEALFVWYGFHEFLSGSSTLAPMLIYWRSQLKEGRVLQNVKFDFEV